MAANFLQAYFKAKQANALVSVCYLIHPFCADPLLLRVFTAPNMTPRKGVYIFNDQNLNLLDRFWS
jgi:hypothetical protein